MASLVTIGFLLEILLVCGLIWLVVNVYPFCRTIYLQCKAAAQFPSLPRHWLWGTIPTVMKLGLENFGPYLVEQSKKHGKAIVFWRGGIIPELFVTHSETMGEILRTSEPKNRRYKAGYSLLLPWLGEGLLINYGKKWERNRKLLTPAFHFSVLQPYIRVYSDAADIMKSKFDKVAETGQSIEIFDPVALCTLDIMLRCAFSYEGGIQEAGSVHPYVKAVKRLAHLIGQRQLNPAMSIDWIYYLTGNGREFKQHCDYVHNFADEIIERRRSKLASDPDVITKRHLDFLDILLAARDDFGVGLSKEDLRAEVDTFLFEGHDTTASAISWALYALARYPDVQAKVYEEVHSIMGDGETFEWADLNKLKYTSLFIKEVMRMYSPVPDISRQLTKPMLIDGKLVPAEMVILTSIRTVHHNPEVWENPEEFRPERFSDDKFLTRDPYSYVPFSAGPRNCIGQNFALNEEKVILSKVVNKFRLLVDTDHPIALLPELVTRATHGIMLKFIARN